MLHIPSIILASVFSHSGHHKTPGDYNFPRFVQTRIDERHFGQRGKSSIAKIETKRELIDKDDKQRRPTHSLDLPGQSWGWESRLTVKTVKSLLAFKKLVRSSRALEAAVFFRVDVVFGALLSFFCVDWEQEKPCVKDKTPPNGSLVPKNFKCTEGIAKKNGLVL